MQKREKINWTMPAKERELVLQIVERFKKVTRVYGDTYDIDDLRMDITACHLNGMPLDLKKLVKAPDFDFIHDICGISRHMNRRTGKIEGHFLPRCAAL